MDHNLAAFLGDRAPVVTEPVASGDRFRFRVAAYLGADDPPLPLVTSVRAVVLRHGRVLVQRDRTSRHILPGGRRDPGEPPDATVGREVREETGWELGEIALVGFMHYHHVDPRPAGHPYPYPDFVQMVYAGRAISFSAAAKLDDGFEVETTFRPLADARCLHLPRRELAYLAAALRSAAALPDL